MATANCTCKVTATARFENRDCPRHVHEERRKLRQPKLCKHGNSLNKPCADCKAQPPISMRAVRAALAGDAGKLAAAL